MFLGDEYFFESKIHFIGITTTIYPPRPKSKKIYKSVRNIIRIY